MRSDLRAHTCALFFGALACAIVLAHFRSPTPSARRGRHCDVALCSRDVCCFRIRLLTTKSCTAKVPHAPPPATLQAPRRLCAQPLRSSSVCPPKKPQLCCLTTASCALLRSSGKPSRSSHTVTKSFSQNDRDSFPERTVSNTTRSCDL